ncbi:hypothetical protein YC2023_083934 [Brassica napus]
MELAKVLDCVPFLFIETLEEANAKILLHAYISQRKLEGLPLSSHMVYTTQLWPKDLPLFTSTRRGITRPAKERFKKLGMGDVKKNNF